MVRPRVASKPCLLVLILSLECVKGSQRQVLSQNVQCFPCPSCPSSMDPKGLCPSPLPHFLRRLSSEKNSTPSYFHYKHLLEQLRAKCRHLGGVTHAGHPSNSRSAIPHPLLRSHQGSSLAQTLTSHPVAMGSGVTEVNTPVPPSALRLGNKPFSHSFAERDRMTTYVALCGHDTANQ